MHAVVITEPGPPEVLVWSEVPDPEPAAGEVLVDVAASAVNRADLLQRQGFYPPTPDAPPYPGLECSGRIVRLGSGVTGWAVGDEVCALLAGGGYAEQVAVPAGQLLPIPRGVSLEDAAVLPEVACTVWSNLVGVAGLRADETLLVHGGGSGVGTFAIQFAAAIGPRVLATARATKHEAVRALGATPIDYEAEDFVAVTRAAGGADVILDIMGAAYFNRNVEALNNGGRLVIIGLQGGRVCEANLGAMLAKRVTVAATTLRTRPLSEKAEIVRGVREDVWPLIEAGVIKPVIDRRVPLPEAAQAHRVVEAGQHVGKVLLIRRP
jgi:putative PIG3 family NAD(P)H quinone oxidoreductase